MNKCRILGFDLSRIVAIFYIVGIYHNLGYAGTYYYTEAGILSLVYSSLGVFTFLSAFLLSSKYDFSSKQSIVLFYKKRIVRVWPLFALSSFLLVLIHFNALIPTLKGLVGLSPFWKPAPTTMWYVAMLISLYAITPFVVGSGSIVCQCIKVLIVMSLIGVVQLVFNTVVPKTFNYYTVYLIGLLLGRNYYDSTMRFLSSKKTLFVAVIWLALFLTTCISHNNWIKSVSGVVGIVAVMNCCILFSKCFHSRQFFLRLTSLLSYSTFCAYLFHREVIWLLLRIRALNSGWPVFLYMLFIGVPFTFAVAYLIQRMYDLFSKRFTVHTFKK